MLKNARTSVLASFVVCLFSTVVAAQGYEFNPTGWGQCQPSPTVVNPAVVSPLQKVLSLRGTWDFKTDAGNDARLRATNWFSGISDDFWSDAMQIEVPGCWEAQGVGEPGMSETWDCKWDCNCRPLDHIYMGGAVYHKKVAIPEEWKDCRVWLKVGGVRSEGTFFVNNTAVGVVNNYCGAYKYDVTDIVVPGEDADIMAFVRNDVPSRKGQMCDYHKFGGLYRDVELEATPNTWIDEVWVQGQISESGADFPQRTSAPKTRVARVHYELRTVNDEEDSELIVRIKTVDGKEVAVQKISVKAVKDAATSAYVDVPVEGADLWTPESPTLYLADVELVNHSDQTRAGWTERFGFRKLEVIGKRFFLNGVPYFMRGYGETFIYPMTLISPADRDVHRANFAIIKESGFNEARMHTHCELPEYFEAADEAGVLLQPELPYYSNVPCEGFEPDPLRDMNELYRHYRRYVSFCFYCAGNEGGFDEETEQKLYNWVKENDPDRPYQLQDGGRITPQNSDFLTKPITIWDRGAFDDQPYPFMAHEYMNLTIKLDPRLEPLFTGAMPALVSVADYEARLEELGLTREEGDACIKAQGALQAFWQQEGVESARRDPECDGYSFWNFIDQMCIQGPAYTSQGYLNAFYQVKDGGITPKEFARFNSPTSLLPEFRSDCDVYTAGTDVSIDVWLATYEDKALEAGEIEWKLTDVRNDNATVAEGVVPFDRFEIGQVSVAASIDVQLPKVKKASEIRLFVKIAGKDVENQRSVWVFPEREKVSLKGYLVAPEFFDWFNERYDDVKLYDPKKNDDKGQSVLIAPYESESCAQGVKEGRRVVSIRPTEGSGNVNLGWWNIGAQLGTAFMDSPAFGDFPHNNAMIPSLWFRILADDPLEISIAPKEYKPLALGELLDDYALYVGEKRDGDAKVLAVFGINLFKDVPEATSLLDSLLKYAASDDFNPER